MRNTFVKKKEPMLISPALIFICLEVRIYLAYGFPIIFNFGND